MVNARETKEKERTRRGELGKYFFDLSKLSFTGIGIVGYIALTTSEDYISAAVLLSTGGLLAIAFAMIGNTVLK